MASVSPAPLPRHEPVETLSRLAHELAQPISAIESITYYLEMILPRGDARVRPQLEQLRRLVDQLGLMVSDAVHELEAESRERAKSTNSGER